MALVNMKDLLLHAYNNRYAVGAFGIVSLDFLQVVIAAAEKARSPVILNLVETHFELFDVELLAPAVVRAAKRAGVPVAVHMDHCSSMDSVHTAIRLGCNSVMYDASDKTFPVNADNTAQVVKLAHSCGIPVEGGLGYVANIDDEAEEPENSSSVHTSIQEAKLYTERTQVDFLAISIGTVHGHIEGKPRLDFNRLSRINQSANVPLVIHGGSGLTEQQYQKLISNGVARINYYTALSETAVKQIHTNLSQGEIPYSKLYANVKKSMTEEVQRCMQIWGSAGRAAEVLIQCSVWRNVEHIIVYNPSTDDAEKISEMLMKGKQDLSKIPGVLEVQIGRSVNPQGKFQYCWLIRFAHEKVVDSYKNHPTHVAYADNQFRALAADRITNDYEMLEDSEFRLNAHQPINV
jgi:fructose-bisphosphate aldolase class II